MLERAPHAYPTLLRAVALTARGHAVAIVIGADEDPATDALAQRARLLLHPEDAIVVVPPGSPAPAGVDPTWLVGREAARGVATLYLCRGTHCSLPVTDPGEIASISSIP
jgi:uncharacterized protein YyaL (SSP411 family)